MAKEPAQRYQQPAEVAQALAPYFKQGVKPIPTGTNRFTAPPPGSTAPDTSRSKAADATRQPTPAPTPAGPAPVEAGAPVPGESDAGSGGTSDGTNPMRSMLEFVVDSRSHSTAVRTASGRLRSAQAKSMPPKIWVGVASACMLLVGLGLWASGVFGTNAKKGQGDLVAAADEPDSKPSVQDFKPAPDSNRLP